MVRMKGVFQRTRDPMDVVFAKSFMEKETSLAVLTADPAFLIFLRALRVAKREFVYTGLLHE